MEEEGGGRRKKKTIITTTIRRRIIIILFYYYYDKLFLFNSAVSTPYLESSGYTKVLLAKISADRFS